MEQAHSGICEIGLFNIMKREVLHYKDSFVQRNASLRVLKSNTFNNINGISMTKSIKNTSI